MMIPLGSAGGPQERVREVGVEESKVRATGELPGASNAYGY